MIQTPRSTPLRLAAIAILAWLAPPSIEAQPISTAAGDECPESRLAATAGESDESSRRRSVRRPVREGTLVWADEFNGSSIDDDSWEHMLGDGSAYDLPPGWGNNELQSYTDRPENSFVSDGFLHIVVRRDEGDHAYTSARLRTLGHQEFLYGRFEARIRVPSGKGIWPALWMLPSESAYGGWAASGEIDIIETINFADAAHGTIHFGGEWPANVKSGATYSADDLDLSESFHIYAIEWTPDEIRWYVDDVCYHRESSADWFSAGAPERTRAPFDRPFHLLVNVAVGGNWPGSPDESTPFPQEMLVDWIRVWEIDPSPESHGCHSMANGGETDEENE